MKKKNQYFDFVKASETKGEIFIYGDIVPDGYEQGEDTSAGSFRDALAAFDGMSEIDIRINSGGGDVFTAVAIYNILKRHKAKTNVYIDGLAASAASVIAMAGDTVTMPSNAMLMIHNAWTFAIGNHHDLRKSADDLERINNSTVKQSYMSRNEAIEESDITRLMDEETWLTAAQAREMGLVDSVSESVQVAASITDEQIARYKNTPEVLQEPEEDNPSTDQDKRMDALESSVAELVKALSKVEPKKEEPKRMKSNFAQLFTQ